MTVNILPCELTRVELHKWIEILKGQVELARRMADGPDNEDLITELDQYNMEKQALEMMLAQCLEELQHTTQALPSLRRHKEYNLWTVRVEQ